MNDNAPIRRSHDEDWRHLERLYPSAFPQEELRPLVRTLLDLDDVLSLVCDSEVGPLGHILFTPCSIEGRDERLSLLGPLAVAPHKQRQGVGGALIKAGLDRLKNAGASCVLVLGDPTYYGRFGFQAERHVAPPYPLPEIWNGAWRSLMLEDSASPIRGVLSVPSPWRHENLWTD